MSDRPVIPATADPAFALWYSELLLLEKEVCGDNRIIDGPGTYEGHFNEGLSPREVLDLEISYTDWE